MQFQQISALSPFAELRSHAGEMQSEKNHLKHLCTEARRLARFSMAGGGLWFDFSRQRVTEKTLDLLQQLAEAAQVQEKFSRMAAGERLNITEKRSVLHMACRRFSDQPLRVAGEDVLSRIAAVRDQMKRFARQIQAAEMVGSTGKAFRHVVVIGIGGSYLGTQFVANALQALADRGIQLHFLANVDIHNFGQVADAIDPQTTLWIVISKSYTTAETMANEKQAVAFMHARGLDPARHLVTVTAQGSPGDRADKPVLASFHMFDFIGGRYSVSSAVGGVPLSLYLGWERFEGFLKGAERMDQHTLTAPIRENPPLMAALISVWNATFLGYAHQAIIPYATPLNKLAPHIQQLNMESNGKSATIDGHDLNTPAGIIVFGEPGTNAQHSFFQLAHQGRPFPIDFIGVLRPQYPQYNCQSKGVSNHQELWANMIAQAAALAEGKTSSERSRHFPGNRPSSTLILKDLSPESVGALLSFYEARTIYESFLWGINAFDQFGVELGKVLANNIRNEMAARNLDPTHDYSGAGPITAAYLNMLQSGKIPS
jgi:glucose-6-phosphate isomerase